MRCNNCGKPLSPGDTYCSYCGAKVYYHNSATEHNTMSPRQDSSYGGPDLLLRLPLWVERCTWECRIRMKNRYGLNASNLKNLPTTRNTWTSTPMALIMPTPR